ncbi:MAG: DUF4350 domain-containing protein, partial [Acidimicrobiales bacterium]
VWGAGSRRGGRDAPMNASGAVRSRAWRRGGACAAVALLVAAVIVLAASAGAGPEAPLSPASTSPAGAKGLALLVARLGGRVDTSGALPPVGRGVALILSDQLDDSARARLEAWVRAGGTLVVADPSSPLEGAAPAQGPAPNSPVVAGGPLPPGCSAPWVAGVGAIDTAGASLLAPGPGQRACFVVAGGAAYALESALGRGSVVALASPQLWTNAELAREDNSVLAADLLVSGGGATVAWMVGPPTGASGPPTSLAALLPGRVKELLVGLLVAFVALALWRANRLGRPVVEELPVVIPGSQLVDAVGRRLGWDRQVGHAAELLRADAVRRLGLALGQPDLGPAALATILSARTGKDRTTLMASLSGPPPAGEAELMDLASALDALLEEVAHAPV